jgi:hypothetical protein
MVHFIAFAISIHSSFNNSLPIEISIRKLFVTSSKSLPLLTAAVDSPERKMYACHKSLAVNIACRNPVPLMPQPCRFGHAFNSFFVRQFSLYFGRSGRKN